MRWALLFSFVALPALAESAIVLVPEGAPSGTLERARAGAIEALAEHGIRLVRAPDGPECDEPPCAAELARTSGVDFVALVIVEAHESGGQRVRVALVAAEGEPREAAVPIGDAGANAAAAAAADRALDARAERRLGFIAVRTRPPGARVEIDGAAAGESPLRRMVAPGSHEVRITPNEGHARTRQVHVEALRETTLDEDLRHDEPETHASTGPRRTEPSGINWLITAALAVGGVGLAISPLETIATQGQCVTEIMDVGCRERVSFGVRSGILLVSAILALAGAVAFEAWAPLRVEVAADDRHAYLEVDGSF